MIISHRHRFIFIKTQKTAGTSIEVALSKLVGEDAVVTPVYPPVEGHHPRNFELPGTTLRDRRWEARFELQRLSRRVRGRPISERPSAYWNHMRLREVLRVAGEERLAGYTSFAFERDPFDKVLSAWRWATRDEASQLALTDWLRSRRPPARADYLRAKSLPVDFDRYSLDGSTVGVDHVGRFEHLIDDLTAILGGVGLDLTDVDLPRVKATRPPGSVPATQLTSADVELIAQAFSREITTFGYVSPSS